MNITDIALEEQQEEQETTESINELADFTADLVSLKQTEPFLHKLFSKNSGTWVDVFTLCVDVKQVKPRIEQLQSTLNGSLLATWLDYPGDINNADFCVILFFVPDLVWSNTAIYNTQRLLKNLNHHRNGVKT